MFFSVCVGEIDVKKWGGGNLGGGGGNLGGQVGGASGVPLSKIWDFDPKFCPKFFQITPPA